MPHDVFLDNQNVINDIFDTRQTEAIINDSTAEIDKLSMKLRSTGKLVRLLGDLTRVTSSTFGARRRGVAALNTLDFDKAAYFGANLFIKYVANLIIHTTDKTHKIIYFNTKEEALDWLLKPDA